MRNSAARTRDTRVKGRRRLSEPAIVVENRLKKQIHLPN
jgi:hypothetical protein